MSWDCETTAAEGAEVRHVEDCGSKGCYIELIKPSVTMQLWLKQCCEL